MAIDKKYGEVTLQHGDIPADEPVIVFRARDSVLPALLAQYHTLCTQAGSPVFHLDLIEARYGEIMAWQADHSEQVRIPSSDGYRLAWLAEGET
jgi:hypothetical protein